MLPMSQVMCRRQQNMAKMAIRDRKRDMRETGPTGRIWTCTQPRGCIQTASQRTHQQSAFLPTQWAWQTRTSMYRRSKFHTPAGTHIVEQQMITAQQQTYFIFSIILSSATSGISRTHLHCTGFVYIVCLFKNKNAGYEMYILHVEHMHIKLPLGVSCISDW